MSYERTEASLRVIGIASALIGFLVVAAIAGAAWMYRGAIPRRPVAAPWLRESSFTGGVNATTSIEESWNRLTDDTKPHLDAYGWTNREQGFARVPIDRAMELIVQRGLDPLAPPPSTALPVKRPQEGGRK